MPLDHSGASAIVSFEGLMLFHTEAGAPCEIGVLSCERHKLDLTIQEITLDETGTPASGRPVDHKLDLKKNIYITVISPLAQGVVPHKPDGFNRENDTGDDEDIRWVLDLQSAELNNEAVELKVPAAGNAKSFKSQVFINHCTLYTEIKTDERFAREHVGSEPLALDFLGKAAFRVAADLSCKPGTEIVLSNEPYPPPPDSPSSLTLKQDDNKQYKIEIENECDIGDAELHGSDFRFYYDAVKTEGGKVFDLRRVLENVGGRHLNDPLKGPANFSSDDFPRTCLVGGRGVGP